MIVDLKQYFGFKIHLIPDKSFEYYLSQKLYTFIYNYLTRPIQFDQKVEKNSNISNIQIDDVSDRIINFIKFSQISDFIPQYISAVNKHSMSKKLNSLQKELKVNWIYSESFQNHIFKLIGIVHKLINERDFWDNLIDQELQISKCLLHSAIFETDPDFSLQFNLNFTIILSRIIFSMLQSTLIQVKPNLKPMEINLSREDEIVQKLLNELKEMKKIHHQFLKKFYNLSLEEFIANYETLLFKLKNNLIFMNSFNEYLKQLTKIVCKIIQTTSKKSKLLKTEQAIISDLANYTINHQNQTYFYTDHKDYLKDVRSVIPKDDTWLLRRTRIIKEIHNYFLFKKSNFPVNPKLEEINLNLINRVQSRINLYLSKKFEFISEINKNQQNRINKYIISIFLLTRTPSFVRHKISELSGLNIGTINNIIKLLNLEIPKNVRERSQIFYTLEDNANFLKLILKNGLKDKLLLAPKQAPKKEDLISNGYEQFYYSIERNKEFSYSDVIKQAGLFLYAERRFSTYFIEKFCFSLVNYIEYLSKYEKKETVFKKIGENESFELIFSQSAIPKNRKNITKAKICQIVVSLALLKCENYECLSRELQSFTHKSERTIRRYIIEYIPLINTIKSLDVNQWMPHPYTDYNFNNVLNIIKSRGFDVLYPTTKQEYEILKSATGVNKMYVKIHCGDPDHPDYEIRFDSILNGSRCKYCTGYTLTYSDIKDLIEFVGLRKSGDIGILITPKDAIEFESLISHHTVNPAVIPISVKCGNPNHPPWVTQYHYIQQGNWCPLCGERYVATGNCIHQVLEYLTLKYLFNQNCSADNEYNFIPNRSLAVDIGILRNSKFQNSIEKKQRIVLSINSDINLICIDFTLSTNFKALKTKFYRSYQSPERLLIIVILVKTNNEKTFIKRFEDELSLLNDVQNKVNIKFLTLNMFLEFIGLVPTIYKINPLTQTEKNLILGFNKYFKLIGEAIKSDTQLGKLKTRSDYYRKRINFLKDKNKKYLI